MSRSERVYRALLRLYPSDFRELYATDAVELFADRLEEARDVGSGAVARLWVRTLVNVIVHGMLERVSQIATGVRPAVGDPSSGLRTALRTVVRAPKLSVAIVATLGVGIAANVALFSVLQTVLLRPLPYPDSDRLVQLWETNPDVDEARHGPSPWNFVDWQREADRFESMAAWYLTSGTYRTESWVEEISSAQVTADFFRTMGVEPLLGRDFQPGEVERYGPVMLSYRVWQRRFGGDPSVVGRTIVSSGSTYRIAGVMPSDFTFPDERVETWVAWDMPTVYADQPESRTWRFLGGVARLAADVSIQEAEAELDAVAAGLSDLYPEANRGWDVAVSSLREDVVGDVRGTLWVAFGSVLFILLIACANVANVLLARVPARLREIRIRTALGATRGRIAGELVWESVLLGLAAGAVGLALGSLFIDGLVALDAGRIPRLSEVSMDPGVLLFTAAVSLATSVLFGVAPMAQLLSQSGAMALGSGLRSTDGAGQRRLRDTFVGAQIAVALVLLTGAALFSASLSRLTGVDPGFDPDHVASFRVSLDPVDGTAEETVRYYDGLLERIAEVPGVTRVGASQTLPLNLVSNDFRRPFRATGSGLASADAPAVQMRIVTPGYVETMGMTVVDGAAIPEEPSLGDPLVALVNETLARRLWPEGGAVGRTLELDFREGWQPYEVVGVVRDVRHYGPREDLVPEIFLSHRQVPYLAMTVVTKTAVAPEELYDALRAAVLSHRPVQPAHNFVSLQQLSSASVAEERFLSALLSIFGVIGLLLSATGVYGVIAYSVGYRRREIGVRMALGAAPSGVVGAVFREAVVVAGIGLAVGGLAVLLLGRIVEGVLYGVAPTDPLTTGGAGLVLAVVAALAAWIPARRAAGIAPAEALRPD